jgi:hypothetical protein
MNSRVLLATFEHEDDVKAATRAVHERGLPIVDVFTPYAVHGLDRAMGLKPSRLTWVCFVCAMIGALGMLTFEHWVAAVSWPLDVGGKPWNSLPADVPVAFEAAVLLAGFGSVFALFGVSRLFPFRKTTPIHPRVTDDRFVLVIEQSGAATSREAIEPLLREHDVIEIEERLTATGGEV